MSENDRREIERYEREKPQRWQDVPWDEFPMEVDYAGRNMTPHDVDHKQDELPPADWKRLTNALNWDFLQHPAVYAGKPISIGLYYGYPKCCIHSFGILERTYRHYRGDDLVEAFISDYDGWIPCEDCHQRMQRLGIETYLRALAARPVYVLRRAATRTIWQIYTTPES